MKKHVENRMKDAIESWDEKPSDIGFDKTMVWNSINDRNRKSVFNISWFKVTAAIILLLLSWGWGNSYFKNKQLSKQNLAMVGNIQTMGEEIKTFYLNEKSNDIIIETKVDTVVKVIQVEKKSETMNSQYQKLRDEYRLLAAKNSELEKQLQFNHQQNIRLEDSLYALNINLQHYINQQPFDLALADKDISLKVDEEALAAIAEPKAEVEESISRPKNKIKLVLFNKSESSKSKAPAKRGIRF